MHWIYPSVAGALFGFGLNSICDAVMTLVIDSYRDVCIYHSTDKNACFLCIPTTPKSRCILLIFYFSDHRRCLHSCIFRAKRSRHWHPVRNLPLDGAQWPAEYVHSMRVDQSRTHPLNSPYGVLGQGYTARIGGEVQPHRQGAGQFACTLIPLPYVKDSGS